MDIISSFWGKKKINIGFFGTIVFIHTTPYKWGLSNFALL